MRRWLPRVLGTLGTVSWNQVSRYLETCHVCPCMFGFLGRLSYQFSCPLWYVALGKLITLLHVFLVTIISGYYFEGPRYLRASRVDASMPWRFPTF